MAVRVYTPTDAPSRIITPPHGGANPNKWCVPAAISAATGCTTDLAALLIAHHRARQLTASTTAAFVSWSDARRIRGAYNFEAAYTFAMLGFSVAHATPAGFPTYAQFVRDVVANAPSGTAFYVCAARHASIVQGGFVADNQGGLRAVSEWKRKRARVQLAYRLTRTHVVQFDALQSRILAGREFQ
jgi:hypothetical protein